MISPNINAILRREAAERTREARRTGSSLDVQRALAGETALLQRTYGAPMQGAKSFAPFEAK